MESALVPVCYFGEFQMNENDRWSWKWTSDKNGVSAILIRSVTSFMDMYCELQDLLNVDPSQYDMDLGFLFNGHSIVPIPPVKVTSEEQMTWLIELNKNQTTPICVTLVSKNILEGLKESDGGDRNVNDFCDIMKVVREDAMVIAETIVTHNDIIVMHRTPEVVQNKQEEIRFTNDDLIALSRQRHKWGRNLQGRSSSPSSNSSSVILDFKSPTLGRRHMPRISSTEKFPRQRKCGMCGATGHTRRFCTSKVSLRNNKTNV